ncbi:MAG TPA: fibronectin type III domain-containing protein [bacterium]|nr:fibronectin type III domain-containing protein [bacterium]HNT64596.1 fibronectin type III domain-containing protein [bacterium]
MVLTGKHKMLSWGTRLVALILCVLVSLAFSGSLLVKWNANTESDLAGYRIHYGTEPGQFSEVIDVGNVTSHVIDQLQEGRTYHFAVTAYDYSGNQSDYSEEVSATVGEPAAAVQLVDNGVELDWTLIGNADGYEIYKTTDFSAEPSTLIATVSAPPFVDGQYSRVAHTGAEYQVRAMQAGSEIYRFKNVAAFNLNIQPGRNLLSLPLLPTDRHINAVLGDQLPGGTNISEADRIYYWNGSRYETSWLLRAADDNSEGSWRDESGAEESSLELDLKTSFWLMTKATDPQVVTVTGSVYNQPATEMTVVAGVNFIGMPFPVPLALSQSKLWEDGVVIGHHSVSTSDRLMAWLANRNVYHLAWLLDQSGTDWDGKWLDESGAGETTMQFTPGVGYILWRINSNENGAWTMPNPLWNN